MRLAVALFFSFLSVTSSASPALAETGISGVCGSCRPVARPQHINPGKTFRSYFLAEALRREGTLVMSSARIENKRAGSSSSQLPAPENFGTCIEFIMQMTSKFALTRRFRGPNAYGEINSEAETNLPNSAWHGCSAGSDERPDEGDIYVLTFYEDVFAEGSTRKLRFGKGWFSHIGVFVGSAPITLEKETWFTIDGGDTHAVRVERSFNPGTCVLTGPNEDMRTLHGWIDIDAFADAATR